MKTHPLLWPLGLIATLALLMGGSALWATQARPTSPPGEILVLDERPAALPFDVTASSTETVTLFSVVEPAADFDLQLPPALPDGVTVDMALAIAAEAHTDALITEIRLYREAGVLVYRVDFSDRMRIVIDADSGQILEINPRGGDGGGRRILAQGVSTAYGMVDAIAQAVARYPGTVFEEAELEEQSGQLVYVIELNNGLEVTIDADSGEYRYTELDGERWVGSPPDLSQASIPSQQAIGTALDLFPDASVEEWELVVEEGRLAYDVELDNGVAVYVDAVSGAVIQVEH